MPLLFEEIKNRQVFLLSPNRSINNNSFNTSNAAMSLWKQVPVARLSVFIQ